MTGIKKIAKLLCCALLMAVFIGAAAAEPYETYTYSMDGHAVKSPHAYLFDKNVTAADMGTSPLSEPSDIFVDENENVYIVDTGNSRIVCLDKEYKFTREVSAFKNPETGEDDALNSPKGIYVRDGKMYVADTKNARIALFSAETGEVIKIFPAPDEELLNAYEYSPEKISVDSTGRMYVVCSNIITGVVGLEADGSFTGFVGAKRVNPSVADLFWRMFMTKEQKKAAVKQVPSSYNNIEIDDLGFLYLTTNSYYDWEIQAYVYFRMQDDKYAPVRRINSTGVDILTRQGFFPPVGDLEFEIGHSARHGASQIIDVTLYKDGIYSLLDQKRGRVFTYDSQGNMLFAFGGLGTQEGMVGQPSAFSYKGNDMIVLDTAYGRIVTYKLTDYGQTIFRAIELNSKRKFTEAAVEWENVLRQNNNNHLAYAAMGQSYLTAGEYEKAMTCFKAYGDVKNYSLAFAGARKNIMRIVSLPLVIVLAAVVVLLFKLAGKIKKINKAPVTGKRTVWNQVLYAHHVIFHPFDGFYDIKREGRGSVLSATVILAFTVITFMVKNITTGFIFGGSADSSGITGAALTVLLPFFLWCAANWCLTTLMDGEGKFSHIYMATAYSLVPVALCNIPIILLSNFLTLEEGAIISFIFAASMLWMAFLVFAATITIHRYTLGKNILMILLTVVGIGVILFLGLLFANVIQKMLMFIVNIYTEISFRLQEL